MSEEIRTTLLKSVRSRLDDARRLLAITELDGEAANLIQALLNVTELAVSDCIQRPGPAC